MRERAVHLVCRDVWVLSGDAGSTAEHRGSLHCVPFNKSGGCLYLSAFQSAPVTAEDPGH